MINADETPEKKQKGIKTAKDAPKNGLKTRPPGGRSGLVKYDNKCMVSYPTELYLRARNWSLKRNRSIQDMQRDAMEHYISYLEREEMDRVLFASRKEFKGS